MLNIIVCTRKKNTTFVEIFEYGRKNESVKSYNLCFGNTIDE